jgi:hypothetical protein
VSKDLIDKPEAGFLIESRGFPVPRIIADEGEDAVRRFIEFFAANIRNANTRQAYARAIARFLGWCDRSGFHLDDVEPIVVATFIEQLGESHSKPTVKQHLAAIRMLFDWLVIGQIDLSTSNNTTENNNLHCRGTENLILPIFMCQRCPVQFLPVQAPLRHELVH